jgi:hypothetical protein
MFTLLASGIWNYFCLFCSDSFPSWVISNIAQGEYIFYNLRKEEREKKDM